MGRSSVAIERTMQNGRRQDRLYPVVLIGFLLALVATGLLGVPALMVAGGGILLAALAIAILRPYLEADIEPAERPAVPSRPVTRQYVPSVLESSSAKRRRAVHRHRRRHPRQPVRTR